MKTPEFRHYFTDYRALLPYSLLGIGAGLAAAAIITAFDYLIIVIGDYLLTSGEGFSSLPSWQRWLLPTAGGAILGLAYQFIKNEDREVGIVHVLSRMHSHYGKLPFRNMLTQFLGGSFALATGQSGGREGPGVHLGAAISSGLGHRLGLPDNSQRILIACGTAGAISIAFDTPLAGVIFAMEVIIAEYTVVGFLPVILAAVSANTVFQILGVGEPLFHVPAVEPTSFRELPFVMLIGVASGIAVSAFIFILKRSLKYSHLPVIIRFTIAGAITGTFALALPQIMGIGYGTLDQVFAGHLAPTLMFLILIAKITATACGVGLGLPIGLIGPNLIIGACLGAGLGYMGGQWIPEHSSDPALYAIIGMGACMAAVLNAPLAALLAVVELSDNISIVTPALLAVVAATITRSSLFKLQSAHQTILRHLQRDAPEDATSQLLQNTSVQPVMSRSFVRAIEKPEAGDFSQTLTEAEWVLVQRDGKTLYVLRADELSLAIDNHEDANELNLADLDLRRWSTASVPASATLREALDTMRNKAVEAILVMDFSRSEGRTVRGVITRDIIEHYYLKKLSYH